MFAPLVIGIGFAGARLIAGGGYWPGLYLQSPFVISAFAGVLITLACRPVLLRVNWSRGVAVGLGLALLIGVGPLAEWATAALVESFGFLLSHKVPTLDFAPEILGVVVVAGLMGMLFRPHGGSVSWANLRSRFGRMRRPVDWALRFSLLASLAVALWLALGWLSAPATIAAGRNVQALVSPNLWLSLVEPLGSAALNGDTATASNRILPGMGRGVVILLAYWLRAQLLFLPLLPIALVVRGTGFQLTLVFTLLLFVLGEFAPLMNEQPFQSATWLLGRTALGLSESILLAAAATRIIGQVKSSAD